MRIVITTPSLEQGFGGPSAKALHLARSLRALGHEVAAVGCGEADGAIGLPILAKFHATPIPRTTGALRRLTRGADAVHIIGYRDPVGVVAQWSARRHAVPVVLEPVGMLTPGMRSARIKSMFDRLIGRRQWSSAALIVAGSRAEREGLLAAGVEADRIFLRPNGVDLSGVEPLPQRGAFRERLGIGSDVPLILALSRLYAVKRLEDLLRALPAVPDALAVIAGPDEGDGTLASLESLRADLGLDERVRILIGGVWGRQKAEALADADCLAMPSRSESFGQAAAEAAALGVPVVLSDGCGVAEWLPGEVARTFAVGDVLALAARLREALEPSARRAAAEASQQVRAAFDWRVIAEAQVGAYRMVGCGE